MSPSKHSRRRSRKRETGNNKKLIVIAVALIAVIAVIIVGFSMLGNNGSNLADENLPASNTVMLETNMGDIVIQLRDDMPITTNNFKKLVVDGVYDNTIFHRVVNLPSNLMIIQGGDPTGTGYGDSSIPNIQDEFSDNLENNKNVRGTIAMAKTEEANSGNSQFFFNIEYNAHLDNKHPVFGEVIQGMDVVDAISNVATTGNPSYTPLDDVILIRATLVD
ncbi:MAG: peptidylprolyl isomerase [Candidatus Bathyarchaeia archaeon]|jgi:peptidylprolyl isomerase